MKKFLAVALLFLTTEIVAQNFEGKITYENKYISRINNVTDDQLASMMGITQEFFIKGGDYKSILNGTFLQWQLYINKENRIYTKNSNTSTIIWNDGESNDDNIIDVKLNRNATEILGKECDELVLTTQKGFQKYYFNSSLKCDPSLYVKHKFGNWNEFVSKTKSLPLKIIIDNPQFVFESTATEIKQVNVATNLFQLPVNSMIEKSPY